MSALPNTLPRSYVGAAGAAGPLLFLRDTRRVALGEWVTIALPGERPRRGQVIEAGEQLTVVQVLEETLGLAPARTTVTLTGEALGLFLDRVDHRSDAVADVRSPRARLHAGVRVPARAVAVESAS